METVLVFPCGLPESVDYAARAKSAGKRVVGASSLRFDPAAVHYDDWHFLPYVHEADFREELMRTLETTGARSIFTPHDVVSTVLTETLPDTDIKLLNTSPVAAKMREYQALYNRADRIAADDDWFMEAQQPRLSGAMLAGTLRLVDTIGGMTDNDKIAAMIEAFRCAPKGDIVEIGSWWGRSAGLMLLLARHYDIGKVLCIDPWVNDRAVMDQGVDALDRSTANVDWEEGYTIFQCNLAPLAGGRLNVFRGLSVEAAKHYGPGARIVSETFGETDYSGQISVLHIDGNHTFEQADLDTRLWTPHMAPGGIVIFDDYVWAFGDGPKRVGDAYLADHAENVAFAFVMGTALFVKLKG
ncbi:class I SAM-dependent methyltransferase [Asticcacaulis solisilvae]|uniref:class I SAM-dependent methyltransferase n=1 Tax=Asticcacaulis solisilvae TaxID=1217274 RepID=UPI003FD75756